jgi:Uri superfamily endonuclease
VDAPAFTTYQLRIRVEKPLHLAIGHLGRFDFPAGRYVYTGSAKRNLEARISRHLRQGKNLRWHIDYLLAAPGVSVTEIVRSETGECELNQRLDGIVLARDFGSSDCIRGCGSHLKYLGW